MPLFQRIVLAGIWLTDRDPTLDEIRAYLRKRFAVELPRQKTLETLEALVAAGDLVEARSARFKISEAAHARLDEARATAEQTERRVRDHFSELVARCCPTSDSRCALA